MTTPFPAPHKSLLSRFLPLLLLSLSLSACSSPADNSNTGSGGAGSAAPGTAPTASTETASTETASAPASTKAGAPATDGACMDRIRKDGLRVLTSPDYPPYESMNDQNEIVGFEVDLVNAVAKEMGVEAKFTGQGFDGLIPALLAGRGDLIVSGLSVTPERAKSVAFTEPYEKSSNALVARADNSDINGSDSLKGKRVGVQLGTVQADIAAGIEGADVRSFNISSDALAALKAGQIDALLTDTPVAQDYVKANSDLRTAGEIEGGDKAMAAQLSCTDLVSELNTALAKLQQSGEVERMQKQWFTEKTQ